MGDGTERPHFNIDPRYQEHPGARNGERWSCIDDRTYDGAPDTKGVCSFMGWGPTQAEALEDLENQFQEHAEWQEELAMSEAQRLEEEARAAGEISDPERGI